MSNIQCPAYVLSLSLCLSRSPSHLGSLFLQAMNEMADSLQELRVQRPRSDRFYIPFYPLEGCLIHTIMALMLAVTLLKAMMQITQSTSTRRIISKHDCFIATRRHEEDPEEPSLKTHYQKWQRKGWMIFHNSHLWVSSHTNSMDPMDP